ncbi:MAG: thymidine phosphorylase [Gemmatimonadota bacterium]
MNERADHQVLTTELIERKRDGAHLTPAELTEFLDGYRSGYVTEYQMSAFLMAVFYRGLSEEELSTLTRAIIASGARLDFRDGGAPAVDKHSTGGVGDKVSLVLAPLLAEAGYRVPMMSGRGLGHTGGTLDKLEAIPGFRTDLDLAEFRRVLADVGCAMIGQTREIAPLDGRLYALRDVTGTVPSIPLIASSIVSKKVAEGIEALVLDVKCGSGAFMRDEAAALELARTLVRLAEAEGVRTTALVTGMDVPLGRTVGNALEVRESIECLRGGGPADLRELTLALAAELVVQAGEEDREHAELRLEALLDDGRAAERFARLIERQGGDPAVLEHPERLPRARVIRSYVATRSGWVLRADAREIGLAAVELGAGRRTAEDSVDPSVGFEVKVRPGEKVERGQEMATVHACDEAAADRAARRLAKAIPLGKSPPEAEEGEGSRLRYRVTAEGERRIGREAEASG